MGFRENSGMVIILSLQILINEFKSRINNLNYEKQDSYINILNSLKDHILENYPSLIIKVYLQISL